MEKIVRFFTWPVYSKYEDEDRFVILTTAANESMEPVHDRMPFIAMADRA